MGSSGAGGTALFFAEANMVIADGSESLHLARGSCLLNSEGSTCIWKLEQLTKHPACLWGKQMALDAEQGLGGSQELAIMGGAMAVSSASAPLPL